MKSYSKKDVYTALDRFDLVPGAVVYVSSQLFSLGILTGADTKEDLCRCFFQAIQDKIGPQGTLVVPTFTTETARYGRPFILEETACDTGIFSEYIRQKNGSVRSLHPINSITAFGSRAEAICADAPPSNYGLDSPLDRITRMEPVFLLNIGMYDVAPSFTHHLETHYCVPYLYNKKLDINVFASGKKVEKEFYASLRFLRYNIAYGMKRFYSDIHMHPEKILKSRTVGNGEISCICFEDYYRFGINALKKDPYVFLKNPPEFKYGEVPYDGTRAKRSSND